MGTDETLVEIRRAAAAEATAMAELWLRSRAASVPAIPPPVHTDDEVKAFFERVVVVDREPWVAVDPDGTIVGLLVLEHDDLDQLYVEPGRTGHGIGTRLLEHAMRLRPDGLHLWAFQANTGARRFYERHGFVAVAMTDGENEEGAPDVRYEWRPPTA